MTWNFFSAMVNFKKFTYWPNKKNDFIGVIKILYTINILIMHCSLIKKSPKDLSSEIILSI